MCARFKLFAAIEFLVVSHLLLMLFLGKKVFSKTADSLSGTCHFYCQKSLKSSQSLMICMTSSFCSVSFSTRFL